MSHSTPNYELIRTYYNGQGTEFTIRKRQPTTFIGIFICIAVLLGVKLWTIKENAISSVQVSSTHPYLFRCRTQLWFLYNGRECPTLLAVLQKSWFEALYWWCTTYSGRWFQWMQVSTKNEYLYCCVLLLGIVRNQSSFSIMFYTALNFQKINWRSKTWRFSEQFNE